MIIQSRRVGAKNTGISEATRGTRRSPLRSVKGAPRAPPFSGGKAKLLRKQQLGAAPRVLGMKLTKKKASKGVAKKGKKNAGKKKGGTKGKGKR